MIQAEEKKGVIQWERLSKFNIQVNTLAYVHRALSKHKPATLVVSIEEKEQSSASYYRKNSFVKR